MFRKLFQKRRKRDGSPPGASAKTSGRQRRLAPDKTPEELCGIDPDTMSRETIRHILAALHKRHNAAASSLNPLLRAEARDMLDAIVECRIKYVDDGI